MEIKYQEKGYGNMSGASLLRQIQNEHTPSLDLLIRESVQNSLDAVRPDSSSVRIEITEGLFDTEELSPYFQGITNQLNQKYPGEHQFLAIQDNGTSGLTGPLSLADVHGSRFGNLQKLIYQIAKSQENQGSGGSWGIGKTVYFRVGNGFVIYYSRIFNEDTGRYEERMAATLVEDEEKTELLTENVHDTGIAWWGKKDPKLADKDGTIPLVDDDEIHQILNVFDLEPMKGRETGTLIILPYINAEQLLRQTLTEPEIEKIVATPYWKSDLSQYLQVGLQKWYCPRLDNPDYDGPYLQCTVNGEEILKKSFLPLFSLIQTLYNHSPEFPRTFKGRPVESEKINLRNVFDTKQGTATAGQLSYIRVSQEEMDMLPPERQLSPYADIDQEDAEVMHEPILAYTRKPGMIVSYETDSDWTHTMPKTEPNEFIIAIFQSDRNSVLSEKYRTQKISTLEDYLRKTENADHMSWNDINLGSKKPTVVRNIKTNIKHKITQRYKTKNQDNDMTPNLGLGRKLGSLLLPPEGSSYWDTLSGGSSGSGGTGGSGKVGSGKDPKTGNGSSGRITGFQMIPDGIPQFLEDEVRMPVLLSFGKVRTGEISIYLRTENGKMDAAAWISKTKSRFPAWINSLEVTEIRSGKNGQSKKRSRKSQRNTPQKSGMMVSHDCEYEGVRFRFITVEENSCTSVQIEVPGPDQYKIRAVLSYSVSDFEGTLDFHRVKAESEEAGK